MDSQTALSSASVSVREGEIIAQLAAFVPGYPYEVIANYYIALKTTQFVILAGSSDLDKLSIARALSTTLYGQPSLHWCGFHAHPWWASHTGAPAYFAQAHVRFNAAKLVDFIKAAFELEEERLPFFLGVRRMSPAEVVCYFQDLPLGLLWRADGTMVPIRLPRNLYVTGTIDVPHAGEPPLSQEVHLRAAVIHLDAPTPGATAMETVVPPSDATWRKQFAASIIDRTDTAQERLRLALPSDSRPLAPLLELERRLGGFGFPASVIAQSWRYLAHAFDSDGRGLFIEEAKGNLHVAQDYLLAQTALPLVDGQLLEESEVWDQVSEYLMPRFPRAYDRLVRMGFPEGQETRIRSADRFP